ncbi:hypothetical protein IWQ62_004389 [Dispira parvispora]|uniref:Uncharacterized protein n=1 Tax=Dispira parvispora TaxID=1520584 RepID=A0A9W8AMI2_9FUNG|nr:hypothetical protein IWQ62_004389 [Dispira parvispora]
MKFVTAALTLLAVAAVHVQADCESQAVVDSCLTTTMAAYKTCDFGDFKCQCDAYTQVVSCYDSCPDDSENQSKKASENSTKENYCQHAAVQSSTTTKDSSSTSKPSASAKGEASSTSDSDSADDKADSSDDSAAGNVRPVVPPFVALVAALTFLTYGC